MSFYCNNISTIGSLQQIRDEFEQHFPERISPSKPIILMTVSKNRTDTIVLLTSVHKLNLIVHAQFSFRCQLLNCSMLRSDSVFSLMFGDTDRQLNSTSNKTNRSEISLFIKKLLHLEKRVNLFLGHTV